MTKADDVAETVPVPVDVLRFLHGEGTLLGRWFGEFDEQERAFWWRKHLPKVPAPVDPLLIEAREVAARVCDAWAVRPVAEDAKLYREGGHDDEPEIAFIVERLRARSVTLDTGGEGA